MHLEMSGMFGIHGDSVWMVEHRDETVVVPLAAGGSRGEGPGDFEGDETWQACENSRCEENVVPGDQKGRQGLGGLLLLVISLSHSQEH
jgi:hypothetical protein